MGPLFRNLILNLIFLILDVNNLVFHDRVGLDRPAAIERG